MKYSKLEYIDSQCPICSNTSALIIQIFNSKDIAKHLKIFENDQKCDLITAHVEKLWNSKICYFVRCERCSFDYASPNIPGDSKFYNLIYDHGFNYPNWKWEFEISYNIIEEIGRNKENNNLKLLEIGAGNGNFLKKVATNLVNKENILSTEFSSFGKKEITNFGIQCLSIDISEISTSEYKNFFDFVCLFQVLEHISNLNDFFNCITLLTKKNANILISVPNDIQRLHFINLGLHDDVPPIHVGRWNKMSFKVLAQKHGLEVVNHKIEPSRYIENVSKYIFYKYKGGRYLNPVYKIKNKIFRNLALSLFIIPLILFNINIIINLYKRDFGVSQFVHLRKI